MKDISKRPSLLKYLIDFLLHLMCYDSFDFTCEKSKIKSISLEEDEIFSGLKLKKAHSLYVSNNKLSSYSEANFNEIFIQPANDKNIKVKDSFLLNDHVKTNNIIRLQGDTTDDFSVTNEEEI